MQADVITFSPHKISQQSKIKHMDMSDKVKREINILTKCTHPHLIRMYEVIGKSVVKETTKDKYQMGVLIARLAEAISLHCCIRTLKK